MATSNKVFVSPGVYTSERDLSFVAQSVGVTTLGIVGETFQGPAFEPIFITNFDEFTAIFGGTSPQKFVNTQIPKYEAAYIAKAYLQQSNQLFVTRVLGLSGYDAGPSWSISTIGNVNPSTVELTGVLGPFEVYFTGQTGVISELDFSDLPQFVQDDWYNPYTLFNGNESSIDTDFTTSVLNEISLFDTASVNSGTTAYLWGALEGADFDNLTGSSINTVSGVTEYFDVDNYIFEDMTLTASTNDVWWYGTFDYQTGVPSSYTGYSLGTVLSDITSVEVTAQTFIITVVPNPGTPPPNSIYQVNGLNNPPLNLVRGGVYTFDLSAVSLAHPFAFREGGVGSPQYSDGVVSNGIPQGQPGSELVFTVPNDAPDNLQYYCTVHQGGMGNTISIGGSSVYSGIMETYVNVFSGETYSTYDNVVIATLRSRGINTNTSGGPVYTVSGTSQVTMIGSGAYSGISQNPFETFIISGNTVDGEAFSFETSMDLADTNYLTKVFGGSNFGKPRNEVPLFVEEVFNSILVDGYNQGQIRGLSANILGLGEARGFDDSSSIAYYLQEYQTPETPYLVSELRGNIVYRLFKFILVSDGNLANAQIKISIANISFGNGTFDVIVRDFFDTDQNPVVLEKFTNCSLNPSANSFVAKKIGSANGEFLLNSGYIMVEMDEEAPVDALPCGFEGYRMREYGGLSSPFPVYKTQYFTPGQIIANPPFGTPIGTDNAIRSSGDKVRRAFLGISTSVGFDPSLFNYKGQQIINSTPTSQPWPYITKGFHMDSGATVVTIQGNYVDSGQTAFDCGVGSFQSDPSSQTNPYYFLYARKFTLLAQGGFDGWDVYREFRSNNDSFTLGNTGYLLNAQYSPSYPESTGWGAFKQITGPDQQEWANSDFYAYLWGQQTFSNPEAVDINVFVTPGIDFINNSNLVENAIDVVEQDRADSIYIMTSPDYNMFVPNTNNYDADFIYPQEMVDSLEESGIDSNYTATYYPWILVRDGVNNTQVYIPPTSEVVRNLALTDNIAFPWFATAGYTRGLVNAVKARKKLTQEDRDTLYVGRINPIATFSDVGTVIFGNKTTQIKESALDRINVRRLLLQARKLISSVAVRLLFEQNDDQVRQQFLDSVNPILDSIRRDRGLIDFRVVVSSSPEDMDANQLVGKIFLKPTRALEFIDIEFLITPDRKSVV